MVPVPSVVVGSPSVRMFRCDGQEPKRPAPGRGWTRSEQTGYMFV